MQRSRFDRILEVGQVTFVGLLCVISIRTNARRNIRFEFRMQILRDAFRLYFEEKLGCIQNNR